MLKAPAMLSTFTFSAIGYADPGASNSRPPIAKEHAPYWPSGSRDNPSAVLQISNAMQYLRIRRVAGQPLTRTQPVIDGATGVGCLPLQWQHLFAATKKRAVEVPASPGRRWRGARSRKPLPGWGKSPHAAVRAGAGGDRQGRGVHRDDDTRILLSQSGEPRH